MRYSAISSGRKIAGIRSWIGDISSEEAVVTIDYPPPPGRNRVLYAVIAEPPFASLKIVALLLVRGNPSLFACWRG